MKASGGARVSKAEQVTQLEQKLQRNHAVNMLFATSGIGMMVVENYTLWSHGGEPDGLCEVLKLGSTFTTAFLVVFLYQWHRRKFEHAQLTNAVLQRDTITSSGIFIDFVVEALFYSAHAPAFVNFEFETHYFDLQQSRWLPSVITSDELGTLVMIVTRSYLVVRTLRYLSGVESRQTRGYSNMNKLNVTTSMSMRMIYYRSPVMLMGSLTALLLPVLAFAIQLAERRANHNLDSFANALWLALSSVTALGFGDFVPLTPLGRAIDAVAIGWGMLLYASSIEMFIRLSKLSKGENRVSTVVIRQNDNTKLRSRAAFYIQAAWTAYLERLHREQSATSATALVGNEPLLSDAKFCRTMRSFRELRKEMQATDDDITLIFKEVLDSRSRIEKRLLDLEEKLDEMDAKFEHNIAAMNELLQKNLKYLKHVAS